MTIGYTIGKLQALKAAVLADGKIDWAETDALFAAVLAALVASAAFVAFGVASANRHQNVKTPLDFQGSFW